MGRVIRETISLTRCSIFFFNDTATTEIYTLSLHDALPISEEIRRLCSVDRFRRAMRRTPGLKIIVPHIGYDEVQEYLRSEEHTSELQSRQYLVCRLLLEKKKNMVHQNRTQKVHARPRGT